MLGRYLNQINFDNPVDLANVQCRTVIGLMLAKIGPAGLRLQIEFLAATEHQFDAMNGPLLDLRSKHFTTTGNGSLHQPTHARSVPAFLGRHAWVPITEDDGLPCQ